MHVYARVHVFFLRWTLALRSLYVRRGGIFVGLYMKCVQLYNECMGLCGAICGGCRESIDGCVLGCGAEGTTK